MAAHSRTFLLIIALLTGMSSAAPMRVRDFAFNGVSNRFITPNGDHLNDNLAFSFSNPSDSAGSVKIFDLRGHLLTTIPVNPGNLTCPTPGGNVGCPSWDGRVNGAAVSTGVYIYVISVESVVFSGAVVVIR